MDTCTLPANDCTQTLPIRYTSRGFNRGEGTKKLSEKQENKSNNKENPVVGWAGLGWAGLGWAGLGWAAGLCRAGRLGLTGRLGVLSLRASTMSGSVFRV